MMLLKIVVVAACPFPAERGTPVRIRRLSEGLAARGHSVHVVTYHLGDPVDVPGVRVHRIRPVAGYTRTAPGPDLSKLTVLDRLLAAKAAELLPSVEADVIHAHHVEGLIVARRARQRARPEIPILYDAHTSLEAELPYYAPRGAGFGARWFGRWLDRTLPALADHTVAVTDTLRARFIAQGLAPDRITTVANGLELELFEAAARRHDRRAPGRTVVFAGNLAGYQGVDLMLEAFARVHARHPDARLRIVSRSDFDRFEPLARALGIAGAIDLDRVDFEAVPALLADADVALNPRLDAPGMPQKTLNYLATGLPIVSFAGSAHHLTDGTDAVIVPNGDTAAFSDAICRVLEDRSLAERLSRSAKAAVAEKWNWARSADVLESVCAGLIEARLAGRATGKAA